MNIEDKIKISIEQEKLENELSHKKYELENLNEEKAKENKQLKEKINKLELLIESLELGVTLNQEQEEFENQSIRDLIFNPILYKEYPYHYVKENKIIFSKLPILEPSLEEEIKYKQLKDNWNKFFY